MIEREELMRYLDGELPPDRRLAFEEALERSTELRRELALFRSMKSDLREIGAEMSTGRSVWGSVNERLTRPIGWILFGIGMAVWISYGVYTYLSGADALWEKVTVSAVVVGLAMLLMSTLVDRYQDLKTDPYRGIQR